MTLNPFEGYEIHPRYSSPDRVTLGNALARQGKVWEHMHKQWRNNSHKMFTIIPFHLRLQYITSMAPASEKFWPPYDRSC